MFGHQVYGKLSDGFRGRLPSSALANDRFQDRELRVQVMEKLRPITELPAKDVMFAMWSYLVGSCS